MRQMMDERVHVVLMGKPRLYKQTPLPPEQEQISKDDAALEIIALMLLWTCGKPRPETEIKDFQKPQFVERDWLMTFLHPGLSAKNRRPIQDQVRHKLGKINDALGTNMALPGSDRMRTGFFMEFSHLSVDVFRLLEAAWDLTKEENQEFVIRHGAERLLDGESYPWQEQPPFLELRQRLDEQYLDALHCKIMNLLVQAAAEQAAERANELRIEALLLIEKGRERLRAMGGEHPLAARFDDLLTRIAPLPTRFSSEADDADASPARRHNIPRRITSFVGREAEMTKLETLLGVARIVTIHGMGGCGKTRLALQAARDYAERSSDETWLVELAGVADPDTVPQTVAAVFGLSDQKQGTYVDALIARLQAGRPLLLLDNCEHLIDACAFLTEKLVQFCPSLTVLATSRDLLNIDGEYPVRIEPLDTPPSDFSPSDPNATLLDYEAARLFLDRVRPYEVAVTEENAAATASICARLDGIPLALEMAAARVGDKFSLPEINRRLENRFLFLTNGKRTALPRHKTLNAMIGWSYDLLSEQEQTLFRRLSVFAGGWTPEVAQSVGASDDLPGSDVFSLLTSLLQKNLITADSADPPKRYGMLETVREYARRQLKKQGEVDAMQEKHRVYYLHLAEDAQPQLHGSDPVPSLERLDREIDNLRAAMSWKADATSLRLACALHRFWLIRSYFQEGRQWLERTWDDPECLPVSLKAAALMYAGSLACHQNNFPESARLLEESRAQWNLTQDETGRVEVLYHLGITKTFQGDFAAADEVLQKSLSLADGNEIGVVRARYALGRAAHAQNRLIEARECYEAILPVHRRQRDLVNLADLLMYMGMVATYQDRRAEARALYLESLDLASRLGRTHQIAQLTGGLAELARVEGKHEEARAYCEKSLALMHEVGATLGIASITNLLAATAYDQNAFQEAEQGFEQARAMTLALGQELRSVGILGNIACTVGHQGRYEQATKLFCETLIGLLEFDAWEWIPGNLEEFGYLESRRMPSTRAVTLLIAADTLRNQVSHFRTDPEKEIFEKALLTLRSALGDATFEAARERACAMTKEQAVAYALETRLD